MENLSDIDLVTNIQQDKNTDQCLEELINRHSGIYLDIVNSFMKHCPFPTLRDDIINDKDLTIYNTALRFDKDKGAKFSTFLGNETKWKCLNTSNKNKKNNRYVEMDENRTGFLTEVQSDVEEQKQEHQEEILDDFFAKIGEYPDERVRQIFEMRYAGTKRLTPWREISEKMKLSIQGCINIHNAALKKIAKTIKYKYEIIDECAN